MQAWLFVLILAAAPADPGAGDPSYLSGGAFILHAPPGLNYSLDPPAAGWCDESVWRTDCAGQVNSIASSDTDARVWYILSSFNEPKTFKVVEYGILYDPDLFLYAAAELCTPSAALTIEHPASGSWPAAGSGIAIALRGEPYWRGTMIPTGVIHGYHYTHLDPTTITLGPMPASGGIGWLSPNGQTYTPECIGVLGIDMPGKACCWKDPLKACCLPNGHCVDVFERHSCEMLGGTMHEGVTCAAPGFVCPWACCLGRDGSCLMMTEEGCKAAGGTWYVGATCRSAGGDFDCPR